MSSLPDLTVSNVRDWTIDRYYERGEGYFHDDRIHNTRRHGRTLKALCRGSRPNPYRVEVTLAPDGIAAGSCSCPIGGDGRCKHAVALLLTWVEAPEAFEPVEALTERLEAQSPETLIDIIHSLLERDPSLESVVEFYLDSQDVDHSIDVRSYAEQAFEVRGVDPYDRGYAREVAENLEPLLDRGREHVAAQEWSDACALFQTVANTITERFDTFHDEQGHLISVLDTCGAGLADVLSTAEDQDARSQTLEAVLDLCLWNVEHRGSGGADAAADALREHTMPEERRMATEVLRGHLPPPPNEGAETKSTFGRPAWTDSDDWVRRSLGSLLLDLERDRLDTDAYLDLCRRTGHWGELIDQLLALDRLDAAADAALRHLPDYRLTNVADRLAGRGADKQARSLLTDRLDDSPASPTLLQWLYEHALARDAHETALENARRLFQTRPSIDTYEQVRRAAEPLDRWASVRTDLLDTLSQGARQDLLVNLYLHEDEIDTALNLVEPFAGDDRSWAFGTPFLVSVADAVTETHPTAAIALYEECARTLIEQRGRSNYADAADLLSRAKTLYEHNDDRESWDAFIDTLYEEELHRLPAAQDELKKADLL